MDIVIISNFCGDFSESDNGRFFYIAKLLSDKHSVEIITSSFRHMAKKHRNRPRKRWPFKITFIKEPGYPANVCPERLRSHYVWGINVSRYLKQRKKPDAVYCAVPSLTAAWKAAQFCNKNNIRFIIDIQDLWPEAFQMVFHIPLVSEIVFFPFRLAASEIYRRADAVCAVSKTYADRAMEVNRKCREPVVVYLGTDLDDFDRNAAKYRTDSPVILPDKDGLWIVYCGSLGESYDLRTVIDALFLLKNRRIKVPKLIVIGDGHRRGELEKYAEEKGTDIFFCGMLPYAQVCWLLCLCDIAVNPIVKGAAQSIINKHADYTAAGLAVLNTQESWEYRKLVDSYYMGINCRNGDACDLAENLKKLMENPVIRKEMGKNARKCAEEIFDRRYSYAAIRRMIKKN